MANLTLLQRNILVAIGSFGMAFISLTFLKVSDIAVALWLPAGLEIALVYLWGYRVLPGVFCGIAAISLAMHGVEGHGVLASVGVAMIIGSISVLKCFIAIYIIRRFCSSNVIWDKARDIIIFTAATGLVSLVSVAINLLLSASMPGGVGADKLSTSILIWFFADFTSILVIASSIIAVTGPMKTTMTHRQKIEYGALVIFVLVYGVFLFGAHIDKSTPFQPPVGMLIALAWAIARFKAREVFFINMLESVIMVSTTTWALGPIAAQAITLQEGIVSAQVFSVPSMLIAYFVTAALHQSALKKAELQQVLASLENRVIERTEELELINNRLYSEVNQRAQQIRTMALINDIASAANDSPDPTRALRSAIKKICVYGSWPVGHAFIVTQSETETHIDSARIWQNQFGDALNAFVQLSESTRMHPGEGLIGKIYDGGMPVYGKIDAQGCERQQALAGANLNYMLAFPVLAGDRVVAILEFFFHQEGDVDRNMLDAVTKAGVLLGRVFERHWAGREKERLHTQLLQASRFAGMAEVASGVLHNVGNVLNSVTVAATIASDKARSLNVDGLVRATDLLQAHKNELAHFLNDDPKGQKLLPYLIALGEHLGDQKKSIDEELAAVVHNVDHIKNIVNRQQSYARMAAVNEEININELVDDALEMNAPKLEHHRISVIKEYAEIPNINLDKHNIMQIIGNLISNAKHSMDGIDKQDKHIYLRTKLNENCVVVEVADNGCGIPPDIQSKIFEFGFTTKRDGHGFGLHTCANTIKAMGGKLYFNSPGEGQGTCFVIELPLSIVDKSPSNSNKDVAA
ncbi:MAG: MASE1 domain-containing protein [Gammaproteobacteria bacterium]|nr:MASE1 domain-containing protein [Gammaproteobacteria bacterium]